MVGYVIVFIALVILSLVFQYLPRILYLNLRRKKAKLGQAAVEAADVMQSGEETAAIAMALVLYFEELHDEESGVLTIRKVSKTYSPWSSKIYAVRNQFNRI